MIVIRSFLGKNNKQLGWDSKTSQATLKVWFIGTPLSWRVLIFEMERKKVTTMKFDLNTEFAQIHKIVQHSRIKLELMFTRETGGHLCSGVTRRNFACVCRFFYKLFFVERKSVVADLEVAFGLKTLMVSIKGCKHCFSNYWAIFCD